MLVAYDSNFGRKVEAMAEAMWKEDALIATGQPRAMSWSEADANERHKWMRLAQVALQTETAVGAYHGTGAQGQAVP